jgi:hypothetical protein
MFFATRSALKALKKETVSAVPLEDLHSIQVVPLAAHSYGLITVQHSIVILPSISGWCGCAMKAF